MNIFYTLAYASLFSVLMPISLIIINRKGVLTSTLMKWFLALLVVSFISDAASYTIARPGIPNVSVVNVFFFVQFILLSFMYRSLLHEDFTNAIYTLIIINSVFFIINNFFGQGIDSIQNYSVSSSAAIIIVYGLIWYHQLMKSLPTSNVFGYFPFWISTGVTFYLCFNFLLFIISTDSFLDVKQEEAITLWSFHNLNNIVKNILFTVAAFHAANNRTVISSS